jgi:hypothetical protein
VALNWWLTQYFESVESMYEDRFELYIMRQKEQENSNSNLMKNMSWWKLDFAKPASRSSGKYIQLVPFSLSVKRTKELRALAGWYSLSLFLKARQRLSRVSLSLFLSFYLVFLQYPIAIKICRDVFNKW